MSAKQNQILVNAARRMQARDQEQNLQRMFDSYGLTAEERTAYEAEETSAAAQNRGLNNMASRKIQSLRSSLASMASAARSGRLNEARSLTSAHRATTDDDEDEPADDDRLSPKECPKCEFINAATSKYCSECGAKLGKGDSDASARATARNIDKRSRVIVRQAEAIDRLNRQLDAHESRSIGGLDLSIFSDRELVAYGFAPANNSAFVRVPGSRETALGLISPEQAQAILDQQSRPASRGRVR